MVTYSQITQSCSFPQQPVLTNGTTVSMEPFPWQPVLLPSNLIPVLKRSVGFGPSSHPNCFRMSPNPLSHPRCFALLPVSNSWTQVHSNKVFQGMLVKCPHFYVTEVSSLCRHGYVLGYHWCYFGMTWLLKLACVVKVLLVGCLGKMYEQNF